MELKINVLKDRLIRITQHRRTRRIILWIIAIFVLIGIVGALVAPPLLRNKLARSLSESFHRQVTIEQISINPYVLSASVRGFLMKDRDSTATALSFDELYVNMQILSLFRWGLVLKEIRLIKPYVNLIRNEENAYNFQDIIDEFTSGPSGPTPRFSLNNIEVVDGKIDFDDRPEQTKHTISAVEIGIPFISSLPAHVDIRVRPVFSAIINGAPLQIGGETKPFKDSLETVFHLNIDNLQIAQYLGYAPVQLNFQVPSGRLQAKLNAAYRTPRNGPSIFSVSGSLGVTELVLKQGDKPLASLPSLDVEIDSFRLFANTLKVGAIRAHGLKLRADRDRDGALNLGSLVSIPAKENGQQRQDDGPQFTYLIDEVSLDKGKIDFTDHSLSQPIQKQIENVHISIKELANESGKKADTEISFQTSAKEQFHYSGTLQIVPFALTGGVSVKQLQLKDLQPYYEHVLNLQIRQGLCDLATKIDIQKGEAGLSTNIFEANASFRSLYLHLPGSAEPLWETPFLALKDATVDIDKSLVTIGAFESENGRVFIQRLPDGTFNYARLIKTKGTQETDREVDDEGPWTVEARKIALNGYRIVFEDQSLSEPARITISELTWQEDDLSNAENTRGKLSIGAKINDKGSLRLSGSVGVNPLNGTLDLEVQGIDLMPFQPYLTNHVNFLLTGGRVSTKGALSFDGTGGAPFKLGYRGVLEIADFSSVDKIAARDLLKWKSVVLSGLQFDFEPFRLKIEEIGLNNFSSRVIIFADGKLNLQNLIAKSKEQEAIAKAGTPESPAETAAEEKPIILGKINLAGGRIDFSDFFIKPNYSATLTGVEGTVSELKPEAAGDVNIQAKINNAAPVAIEGQINPLGKELFLRLKAKASDIELTHLSPYSSKYVGYAIEKGKVSLDVNYQVENKRLTGDNKIILNQLNFGEKVDSSDAPNLPLRLAVGLLKDRNGVIEVDLPISGALDDPQFSVGGIVLEVIFNIIKKAVAAPFALLGAAFGSGEKELDYVEFDFGRDSLAQAAQSKLNTLAKALYNRPGLSLEISGRIDPVNDLEGLKRVALERKVKAQKFNKLVRDGNAPKSVDGIKIESSEYGNFLTAAYGEENFPKPRNTIGLAGKLPVAQMEKMMLNDIKVTEADLRQLGSRRAQAARDFLLATGQVGIDRLFIVTSKSQSGSEQERTTSKSSRVEFSLR